MEDATARGSVAAAAKRLGVLASFPVIVGRGGDSTVTVGEAILLRNRRLQLF